MQVLTKKKELKEVDVIVDNYCLCDKCNKKIKKDHFHDAFDFTFEHKTGDLYPEGGSGKEENMDLCQKCIKELFVLLKANGYRINTSEWNY